MRRRPVFGQQIRFQSTGSKDQLHRSHTEEEFNRQSTAFLKLQRSGTRIQRLGSPLVSAANIIPQSDSILEIACGPGIIARECIKQNPASYIGIDISANMLSIAENEVKKEIANIKETENIDITTDFSFIKSEAESLPFEDNKFDVVVSRLAFHHFYDIRPILKEIKRVMKPIAKSGDGDDGNNYNGGRFVLMDLLSPSDDNSDIRCQVMTAIETTRDPTHVRTYGANEMINIMKDCGFSDANVLEVIEDTRGINEWIDQTNSSTHAMVQHGANGKAEYALSVLCERLQQLGCDAGISLKKDENSGELTFVHAHCVWKATKTS